MVTRRWAMLGGGMLLLSGCTTFDGLLDVGGGTDGIVTRQALGPLNELRRQEGLDRIGADRAAERAALDAARTMARRGQMTHGDFLTRVRRNGVEGAAAENIARGQPDVATVMRVWTRSAGHRRNMLVPKFSGVGVAVARNPASGDRPYWAMVLTG